MNQTHTTTSRLQLDNDAEDGEIEFKLYNIKNKKNYSKNSIQVQNASITITNND